MRKFFLVLIALTLLVACDKIDNEQDIVNFFSNYKDPDPDPQLITIKRVDFANASSSSLISGWNATLYASQMRYLYFRISYDCNVNEQVPVVIFIKIFNPNGDLSQGTGSPEGYTTSKTFVTAGDKKKDVLQELGGWGNASQSVYSEGTYKFEIWDEKDPPKKLFEATVRLR